jgi:hypothetical protein
MTDFRITSLAAAYDWDFCPRCGRPLELDQSPDDIVRGPDDEIDVEASEANGFNFAESVKHCGYHIRLWQAVYAAEEELA